MIYFLPPGYSHFGKVYSSNDCDSWETLKEARDDTKSLK